MEASAKDIATCGEGIIILKQGTRSLVKVGLAEKKAERHL